MPYLRLGKMDLKEKISQDKVPDHVAIIMDGNGRWAKKRGNQRIFGHRNGVKAVRETVEAAGELGVKYLTLYAFSTENWTRPKREVDALMSLLVSTIHAETESLNENNVRLLSIGDVDGLPLDVQKNLDAIKSTTASNKGLSLVLAINYSSKWEIINAVKKIALDVRKSEIDPFKIDNELFQNYLNTSEIPNPDLLIRTSGEFRISNFLLWQLAYTELYFTDVLWPDFRKEHLYQAINNYQARERRFGKTSEQLNEEY